MVENFRTLDKVKKDLKVQKVIMRIFTGEEDMTDEQAADIIEQFALCSDRFPYQLPRGNGKDNILLMATNICFKVALGKAVLALRNK